MQLLFHMFSNLMSLEDRLVMLDHPTVLPYRVIPHVIFSSNVLHAVHVPHLDVLRRQIEDETESENRNFLMYGYNVRPHMAFPIHTVLPYCVIEM